MFFANRKCVIGIFFKSGQSLQSVDQPYYPQISGGLGTADLTKGERGRQLFSLNATQMLYDFGKTRSLVDIEEAKTLQEQANVLVNLDEVSFEVANAIINIKRYQEI